MCVSVCARVCVCVCDILPSSSLCSTTQTCTLNWYMSVTPLGRDRDSMRDVSSDRPPTLRTSSCVSAPHITQAARMGLLCKRPSYNLQLTGRP